MARGPLKSPRVQNVSLPADELAHRISTQLLPLVAEGMHMNQAIAQMTPPFPSRFPVMQAIKRDPDLTKQWQTAIDARADVLADNIISTAFAEPPPGLAGAERGAWVAHQRLKFDALRWTASRLGPGRWGDSVKVEVSDHRSINIVEVLRRADQAVAAVAAEDKQRQLTAVEDAVLIEPQPLTQPTALEPEPLPDADRGSG